VTPIPMTQKSASDTLAPRESLDATRLDSEPPMRQPHFRSKTTLALAAPSAVASRTGTSPPTTSRRNLRRTRRGKTVSQWRRSTPFPRFRIGNTFATTLADRPRLTPQREATPTRPALGALTTTQNKTVEPRVVLRPGCSRPHPPVVLAPARVFRPAVRRCPRTSAASEKGRPWPGGNGRLTVREVGPLCPVPRGHEPRSRHTRGGAHTVARSPSQSRRDRASHGRAYPRPLVQAKPTPYSIPPIPTATHGHIANRARYVGPDAPRRVRLPTAEASR